MNKELTPYQTYFKSIANAKKLEAIDIFRNCLVRAIRSKANDKLDLARILLYKAFTPITNKVKLANGRRPYDCVYHLANREFFSGMKTERPDGGGWQLKLRPDHPLSILLYGEEINTYISIVNELRSHWDLGRQYTYIFVRQDILSPEQVAVQAAHATFVAGARIPWKDPILDPRTIYFTLVGINSHEEMIEAKKKALEVGASIYFFYEPDIGNTLTAIATSPIHFSKRGKLREYPLLTFAPLAQVVE